MPDPPHNLFDFALEALERKGGPQKLWYPMRHSASDSYADLSFAELEFLPYRPAAAALSDWFYDFTPGIPEDLPWLEFRYALIEVDGAVHLQRIYGGQDSKVLERASREVLPIDVSASLKAIAVPMIGSDCTDLFAPLATALQATEDQCLYFELDPSPMGGSYLRWKKVEAALDAKPTSERLYHLLFAYLCEWAMDNGGAVPHTFYELVWMEGRIHLQCTPDSTCIPDDVMEEVLKETQLPEGIDGNQSVSWVLTDLEAEHPELHAAIEKKALKKALEEFTLDQDISDMLKGTPDIPWEY